eukprot:scaffold42543_cov22-Tisochrysis_lutea.AAC.2
MEGNAMTCARQHVHDEIAITGARRHMHDGIASSKQNPTNLHMPRTTLPLKNVIHLRQLPSIGALRTALVVSCMPLYAVVSCMPTYCDSYRTVPSPVSHPNTAIKGSVMHQNCRATFEPSHNSLRAHWHAYPPALALQAIRCHRQHWISVLCADHAWQGLGL